MKKSIWVGVLIVAVVIVLLLIMPSGNKGVLTLQITDAPSSLNIEKAFVTLSDIEVHMAQNNVNGTNNETNTTSGWFVVVQGPVTYDLINITNVKQLLGSEELDVGKYTQIRLNVESASIIINGTEYALNIPSSKIKLIHPFNIEQNETTTLTLDFDANESVIKTGNGTYKFQPVVRIIQE